MSFNNGYLTLAQFAFHHVAKKSLCISLALVSALWIILPEAFMLKYFSVWSYIGLLALVIAIGHMLYVTHPVDNPAATGRRISILMFLCGMTGALWAALGTFNISPIVCGIATVWTFVAGAITCFLFTSKGGVDEKGNWEIRLLLVGILFAALQFGAYLILKNMVPQWELFPRLAVIVTAWIVWYAWSPFWNAILWIISRQRVNA